MRILTHLFSLLFCFLLLACEGPSGVCTQDSECPASQKCSVGRGQCVDCLANDDCSEDSFCCEGSCRGIEEAGRYCGCSVDIGGYPGVDCTKHSLSSDEIAGAACQKGGDPVTVDNVREGSCGCTASGMEDCGLDSSSGLYGLCVMESSSAGGVCIAQGAENCGAVGSECNAATGGPFCRSRGDEPGAGVCTCENDNTNCIESIMDDDGNLHVVANNCSFDNSCVCANNDEACNPNGASPDCCGDGCFDLLSDSANCGICGKSCGDNACLQGACECNGNDECFAENGSFNNPGTIANECVGAGSSELGACVCASYRDNEGAASACPLGSFCCFAGGDVTANGCCSKPCGEATLDDCTQATP